jgi:hypothetical protein
MLTALYVLTIANCLNRPVGAPPSCRTSGIPFSDLSTCRGAGMSLVLTFPAPDGRRVTWSCDATAPAPEIE